MVKIYHTHKITKSHTIKSHTKIEDGKISHTHTKIEDLLLQLVLAFRQFLLTFRQFLLTFRQFLLTCRKF